MPLLNFNLKSISLSSYARCMSTGVALSRNQDPAVTSEQGKYILGGERGRLGADSKTELSAFAQVTSHCCKVRVELVKAESFFL